MKIHDWTDIGHGWRIEQDDKIAFQLCQNGDLDIEVEHPDYSGWTARTDTVTRTVQAEVLAEVLRRLGWKVSTP
jgi:hypothetical protein